MHTWGFLKILVKNWWPKTQVYLASLSQSIPWRMMTFQKFFMKLIKMLFMLGRIKNYKLIVISPIREPYFINISIRTEGFISKSSSYSSKLYFMCWLLSYMLEKFKPALMLLMHAIFTQQCKWRLVLFDFMGERWKVKFMLIKIIECLVLQLEVPEWRSLQGKWISLSNVLLWIHLKRYKTFLPDNFFNRHGTQDGP